MKRCILFQFFVMLLSVSTANAQLISQYGVFGGVTSAEHTYDGHSAFEHNQVRRVGWHAGVFAEWLNDPYVSLVSQIWYAEKGAGLELLNTSYENPLGDGTTTTFCTRISYFSFGLLGKGKLPIGVFTPYLLAGPRFDYLVDYERKAALSPIYKDFTETTYGLTVGFGVERYLQKRATILVEFRYHLDLADSYEVSNDLMTYTMRNTSFEISAGVGF